MNILIEGPRWSGMWTEIIAMSLRSLGHRVEYLYHNVRGPTDRLFLAGRTLLHGEDRGNAWARRFRQRLLEHAGKTPWDVLLSIQGKVDAATVQQLRRDSPGLRVIYWWGDILSDAAPARIGEAAGFADRLLVSYAGSQAKLEKLHGDRVLYFPFGVAPAYHCIGTPNARERSRYGAEVAFVGTCYPERCELLRYLDRQLASPVAVWGRGWRHCRGVRGRGALTLHESQLVHACSHISLNLHHTGSDDGGNMRFWEIPAAGGFQICDRRPALAAAAHGQSTITCASPAEFADSINYYLAHAGVRRQLVHAAREAVLESAGYTPRLAALLQGLNPTGRPSRAS
ncbi:MAG TPA: glycosyltransferase [Gammaproteobacteria bacterium]|nr:glycosyltransferase [Gammaproteobacteria bacterium]